MKAIPNFPAPFKIYPILVFMLAITFSAVAQEAHYRDPNNPGKGYWQIYTNAQTRSTSIKFFDSQKYLLYEEVIPGKYIKLTNRNINRINQTFDQITQNNLVVSKIKSDQLPANHTRKSAVGEKATHRNNNQNGGSKITLNTFKIPNTTKLHLTFQNPNRERIKIYLMNDAKQIIYDENVNRNYYNRNLDFAGLHPGKYMLVLTTTNRKFRYTEQIQIGGSSRTWQSSPPLPALITQLK
jgi:hypothetical protein